MMFFMFIVEDYYFSLLVKLLSEFSERGEGRLAPGKTKCKCTTYGEDACIGKRLVFPSKRLVFPYRTSRPYPVTRTPPPPINWAKRILKDQYLDIFLLEHVCSRKISRS